MTFEQEQMWLVRQAESIGMSLRKELGFSQKLRLFEAQVDIFTDKNWNERVFLFKDWCELLGNEDGLNVDEVNPFIIPFGYAHWRRKGKRVNGYTIIVQLCTVVSPLRELEEKERKEYRKNMMEEKTAGTYDENTYKKYKI